jgi:membrane-associated phospholipid phosphatase
VVARRQRRAAALTGAAFLLVLLGVATGATQALDRAAADWLRPDDVWGVTQARLSPVMPTFEPRRAYALLVAVTVVVVLLRRSWRPAAFAVTVTAVSAGTTAVVKILTHRPDPHGDLATTGGSFPSGHVVALLVCLGCCALLCWSRTRWWHWVLVAGPPAAMGATVAYAAAHWVTDVLGGALLAVATLCWAAQLPLRRSLANGSHASTYPTWGSPTTVRRQPGDLPGQLSE